MSDKKRILVVDDSPIEIRILMETLKEDYAVVAATDGLKALQVVEGDHPPELILLDVNMDPIDGYETCKRILEITTEIPIIFVSANQSTEEILKGFEAGGVDYIVKPIDPEVLQTKVSVTLLQRQKEIELHQQKQQANEMVMSALTSAGDVGITQGFLRQGLKAHTVTEVIQALANSLDQFGMQSCVQARTPSETVSLCTSGVVNSLEEELLTRSTQMDSRIIEKGTRMIICFDSVSLLVKNMPVENEKRCGELRDYLMILAEDGHLLSTKVAADMSIMAKRSTLVKEALASCQDTLSKIEKSQAEHKEVSLKIMDEMFRKVETMLFNLGLTEEQEHTLSEILQDAVGKSVDHVDEGTHVDAELRTIISTLGKIAASFDEEG